MNISDFKVDCRYVVSRIWPNRLILKSGAQVILGPDINSLHDMMNRSRYLERNAYMVRALEIPEDALIYGGYELLIIRLPKPCTDGTQSIAAARNQFELK